MNPQCLKHVEKPQMLLCMYAVITCLANWQLITAKSGHQALYKMVNVAIRNISVSPFAFLSSQQG